MAEEQYPTYYDSSGNDLHTAQKELCLHGRSRQVEGSPEGEYQGSRGNGQEHGCRLAAKTDQQPKENRCQKARDQDRYNRHQDWHWAEVGSAAVERHEVLFAKGSCNDIIQ
jgi:hypothetical protein